MTDQADGLRALARARVRAGPAVRAPVQARSLVFTSGKGGVGASNLVLNLAMALGELGQHVVLVDADIGLANLDLLCGITPTYDLGDVLSGTATLAEAVVDGPLGVRFLPGAHGMRTLPEVLGDGPARVASELAGLEAGADFLLVDAGSGLGSGIATLAAAADEVVVVTTPEPTGVADAHAAIGRFPRGTGIVLWAAVNQANSAAEAENVLTRLRETSRQFLGAAVSPLGYVRYDPHVPLSVRLRRPFVLEYPACAAARGVRRMARDLLAGQPARTERSGFFTALAARWALGRPAVAVRQGTRSFSALRLSRRFYGITRR